MINIYNRNCPNCNKEISYKNEISYNRAINKNENCMSCCIKLRKKSIYKRNCPNCNREIKYKNQELLNKAINKNTLCTGCAQKQKNKIPKEFKKQCPNCNKEISYRTEKKLNESISNNTLCQNCSQKGRTKIKISEFKKQCPICNKDMYYKSKLGLKKAIKNNSLCGSCVNKKLFTNERREKLRKRMSGNNNPMFGKVSHTSGRGWGGYYKGYYFRSFLELKYIIYLINNNINFESAENLKYRVQYKINGKIKNYYPNFYLKDINQIIEIKPFNKLNDFYNKVKFQYAKQQYGDNYIIITDKDIEQLDIKLNYIYDLYKKNEIVFDKNYGTKFENKYFKEIYNEKN